MANMCCPNPCPDRSPTCHGVCERYKAYRLQLEAETAAKKAYLQDSDAVEDYRIRTHDRLKRKH